MKPPYEYWLVWAAFLFALVAIAHEGEKRRKISIGAVVLFTIAMFANTWEGIRAL